MYSSCLSADEGLCGQNDLLHAVLLHVTSSKAYRGVNVKNEIMVACLHTSVKARRL